MKKLSTFILFILCTALSVWSNNPLRTTPYPKDGDDLFLNPAPLLVPPSMRDGEFLQFNLSQDKRFKGKNDILSKPVRWGVFNPHRVLEEGTWYWRFRSVDKNGKSGAWSKTYRFTVTPDLPRFATPPAETFLKNIPANGSRIYCFLTDSLASARREMRSNPEFEWMVDAATEALSHNYRTDTDPYKHIMEMSESCDKLLTAYLMLGRELYVDKMVENVKCLLPIDPTPRFIGNDFNAGELVYLLACTYEAGKEKFTPAEQKRITDLICHVISYYYKERLAGKLENRLFDEHLWQFTMRRFTQGALVLYGQRSEAEEWLEYLYEAWTSRAPATGFNRDGDWQNGANYFSANAVSLMYMPSLFGYLTGTDFLQHPWYQQAGKGVAFTWLPNSLSSGFGDGHEKTNQKPLRIRSAFADFLARETRDPYATWYSSKNDRYRYEFETRLYRMASGKQRPTLSTLPDSIPETAWFDDCGEMIANSNLNHLDKNVSLSFHSSPFGSGNHTHSNQNAFNLHYGGEAVFHASGHYMKFDDAHNLLAYRHTQAHNTILVDGIGQSFTPSAYGNIVRELGGDHLSYALGDASKAYRDTSDIDLWKRAFKENGLEQSPQYGFGKTGLKKYRRHILLLKPNTVIVYDELEADTPVRWDWLLHSPVSFKLDEANGTMETEAFSRRFRSHTNLWGSTKVSFSQTDQWACPPNERNARRGEDFTPWWTFTAQINRADKARFLAVIQIEDGKMKFRELKETGTGEWTFGDWTLKAELDAKRPAYLLLQNAASDITFECKEDASILHDTVNGKASTQETSDRTTQRIPF